MAHTDGCTGRSQRQEALIALETAGFTDRPMSPPRVAEHTKDPSILAPCSITRRLSFGRHSSSAPDVSTSPAIHEEERSPTASSPAEQLEQVYALELVTEDTEPLADAGQSGEEVQLVRAAAELAAALANEELVRMRNDRDRAVALAREATARAEAAERELERLREKEGAQTLAAEVARKRLVEDGMLRIQLGLCSAVYGAA